MTNEIVCPSCASSNRADATHCQACGRELEAIAHGTAAQPVILKRVLSGEVFAALLGEFGKPFAPEGREGPPDDPVIEMETPKEPDVEDHSDVIAGAIDRIRARASEEGQGFKPYVRSRHRKTLGGQGTEEAAKHLEAAVALFRERRFQEAIEPLLKAIARDDEDRRAWILLAEAYLRAGRAYKAAVGYLRALELSPKDEQAWLGLGRVLRSLDDLPSAAAVLDRATQIHPEHVDTWSERGFVLESMDRLPESARSFERVLAIRPDHRLAQMRLAEIQAKLAQQGGDVGSAEPTDEELDATPGSAGGPAREEEIFDEIEHVLEPDETRGPATEMPQNVPSLVPSGPTRRPTRVRTFVEGLDETLEGGVPWGHVVLVEGAPGTMKSSLAFSILLHNAAREGLHCLYLSLEERTSSLLKQMGSLGLKLDVPKGSLVVLDPKTANGLLGAKADWIDALKEGIRSIKAQRGLDVVALDSLEALEVLAKFKDRRREMYRLFEWLRDLDVTSIIVAERPDWIVAGHVLQGRWDEDFLADGVFHLRLHMVSDLDAQRRLRIVKMRGTKHETGYLAMVLDDGRLRVTRAMSP